MQPLAARYQTLRDRRFVAHASIGVGVVVATAAALAFTAQDLPVLPRVDVDVIGFAVIVMAGATSFAAAGCARRGGWEPKQVLATTLGVAIATETLVVFLFKLVGGIGWPDWEQLVATVALVTVVVLLAHALSHLLLIRGLAVVFITPLIAAMAVVVYGLGLAQLSAAARPRGDARKGVCEEHLTVTYCAFPGEEGTIPYWQAVTEDVLSQVPPEVAAQAGLVVQSNDGKSVPGAVAEPAGGWTSPGASGVAELVLGLDVADWATGVRYDDEPCQVSGQARAIVAMWLAGQVSPASADLTAHLDVHADSITGSYAEAIHGGNEAGLYAAQLFARPAAEVGEAIRSHWDALVDPASDYFTAEELLDLSPVNAPRPPGDDGKPITRCR